MLPKQPCPGLCICEIFTWKAKLLTPATRRASLPVHACPEAALGATALLSPEAAMLGWAYALSFLHIHPGVISRPRLRARACMGTTAE